MPTYLSAGYCNVTELQGYYMQQYLKKPQHVMVHAFMACMGLLIDYLAYLPMVKDSPMAVEDTKKGNTPFDKADLAGIMLKAAQTSWVNLYNLTHLTLPNPQGCCFRTWRISSV
jgi:hypothetical protein